MSNKTHTVLSSCAAVVIASGAVGCAVVDLSDQAYDDGSGFEEKSLTDTVWPISGSATPQSADDITDSWGPRLLSGNYDFHRGIDIAKPTGTNIYAARDGQIVRMEYPAAGTSLQRFGRFMVIAHDDIGGVKNQTAYLHMSAYADGLEEGDYVEAGDKIGEVGNTGVGINTEHLHFEYYENINSGGIVKSKARSPMKILQPASGSVVPTVTVTKTSTEIAVEIEQEDDKIVVGRIVISPVGASADRTIDLQTGEGLATDWDDPTENDVTIDPDNFNTSSSSQVITYRYAGSWSSLGACDVEIYDVSGTLLYDQTTTF
ncbi:M23 family metallopeptidase [Haliangium sp.]|uniref:M23 family metallopeptidase n=1 Tax=Haliangium sp. TaxID=2663208 RepID=UPI003D0A1EF5